MKHLSKTSIRGFTLIELLIVIAVLGILSTILFVAINPIQQFARARDAGRKSTVDQLVKAMQAYYTSHGGAYIDDLGPGAPPGTWITKLQTAGEIQQVPQAVAYSVSGTSACVNRNQSNFCLDGDSQAAATRLIIYTVMESGSEKSKCASGLTPYFLWSSADNKSGTVCLNPYDIFNEGTGNGAGYTYLQ